MVPDDAMSAEIRLYGAGVREARPLAAALVAHGARANALVAVFVHRSLDMIVGLVGVLYAGAAYLPLDMKLPDAELRTLVAAAQPVAAVVGFKALEAFKKEKGRDVDPPQRYKHPTPEGQEPPTSGRNSLTRCSSWRGARSSSWSRIRVPLGQHRNPRWTASRTRRTKMPRPGQGFLSTSRLDEPSADLNKICCPEELRERRIRENYPGQNW